jgi:methylmalonyl-CoA/ethylmalonyl-CoA epimerase
MPTTTGSLLRRIGQISVNAHDLDRATAFYRDTLGLAHQFSANKMAFFDCGGVRLMVGLPETPEFDHPGSVLYFDVADLAQAHETLVGRGVSFIQPPHRVATLGATELWMAFFRDSEGNILSLMSQIPAAA